MLHLAGIPLPENEIDGKNVWDLVAGKEGAENPQTYYAFSNGSDFQVVMSGDGRWKLHLPHEYRTLVEAGNGGMAGKYEMSRIDTALFDMQEDPNESTNVLENYPEVAISLIELAELHKQRFYSN